MAQKIQRFTRKKLHRQRAREIAEARAEAKLQRAEEKRRARGGQSIEAALRGCEDW